MSISDTNGEEFDEEEIKALIENKKALLRQLEELGGSGEDIAVQEDDSESSNAFDASPTNDTTLPEVNSCPFVHPTSTNDVQNAQSDVDSESDIDVDELLEKPVALDGSPKQQVKRAKRVLEHRGTDHFNVLPDGWIEVTHNSGLPVYLHRQTRCCTFSRPYFIGPSSARHHCVPKSAIPCLYQKAILSQLAEPNDVKLDTEKEKSDVNKDVSQANGTATTEDGRPEILNKLSLPNVKVQTLKDVEQNNLTPDDLHDYASAVFKFKTINLYRFPKWSEQRNFNKKAKRQAAEKVIASDLLRPGLPSNVKLITVPALDSTCKPQQRNFYLNPQGKTSINILHEYVQKVLKTTVKYFVSETRNCANPYQCTVKVKMAAKNNKPQDGQGSVKEKIMRLLERSENDVETTADDDNKEQELFALADGVGNSKKNAKLVTAKKALEHLIPGLEFDEEGIAVTTEKVEAENEIDKGANVAEIFDLLRIEDSRIADLCTRAGQPTPYLILQECLKRNSAFGDTEIQLRTNPLKRQKHEFEMIVGKHSVKVICSNKREGKQKAAQAMIQKLHPERSTWGSILRLYGYESQLRQKEARKSTNSVIKLQGANKVDNVSSTEPNLAILDKLRSEMKKLENKWEAEGEPQAKRKKLIGWNDEPIRNDDELRHLSHNYSESHPESILRHIDL